MIDPAARGLAAKALGQIGAPKTLVMFGDSRTANAAGVTVPTINKSTNLDWFMWGQALCSGGPRFNVVANTGIGGNTTTQMLARFSTDVLAYAPTAMTLWGGINDAWATTADVDATYLRMKSMLDQARGAGIHVFLISETVGSNNGVGYPPLVFYYNELLREYAYTKRGVTYLDFNSQYIDPASATGYPLAALTIDGTHPNTLGCYAFGKNVVAPALAAWPPVGIALLNSPCDNQGYNAASRNLLDVGLFAGSGGSKGSGHTGTLATGWSTTGACTATLTTPARSDGFGNNQVCAVTAASGTDTFTLSASLNQGRLVTGAKYALEAELTLTSTTKLLRSDLDFVIFAPGSYAGGVLTQVSGSSGDFPANTTAMILRSPEFTSPGSATGLGINLRLAFNAAGGATTTLGRVSLKRVS